MALSQKNLMVDQPGPYQQSCTIGAENTALPKDELQSLPLDMGQCRQSTARKLPNFSRTAAL
jgi:hypothetical protein